MVELKRIKEWRRTKEDVGASAHAEIAFEATKRWKESGCLKLSNSIISRRMNLEIIGMIRVGVYKLYSSRVILHSIPIFLRNIPTKDLKTKKKTWRSYRKTWTFVHTYESSSSCRVGSSFSRGSQEHISSHNASSATSRKSLHVNAAFKR